jgi:hypothetical protein
VEGRVSARRFAGRSYPVTFLRLNDADAVYRDSCGRVRAFSSIGLIAGLSAYIALRKDWTALLSQERAANQPGGVATLSRHFFIAPSSVPAKQ